MEVSVTFISLHPWIHLWNKWSFWKCWSLWCNVNNVTSCPMRKLKGLNQLHLLWFWTHWQQVQPRPRPLGTEVSQVEDTDEFCPGLHTTSLYILDIWKHFILQVSMTLLVAGWKTATDTGFTVTVRWWNSRSVVGRRDEEVRRSLD